MNNSTAKGENKVIKKVIGIQNDNTNYTICTKMSILILKIVCEIRQIYIPNHSNGPNGQMLAFLFSPTKTKNDILSYFFLFYNC